MTIFVLLGQVHQISEESEAPAESEEATMDDDQLMQNIVTMEEVTKELQKSWMDLKMSITKLSLINEVIIKVTVHKVRVPMMSIAERLKCML